MNNIKREYIRHPAAVPILFNVDDKTEAIETHDIGDGGLCFVSHHSINTGTHIQITIPMCSPEFKANGIVRWCKHNDNTFLIGVAFQQESVFFSIRMVEQVCHIENYRKKVMDETGVELSTEQAAREWIGHYASEFP